MRKVIAWLMVVAGVAVMVVTLYFIWQNVSGFEVDYYGAIAQIVLSLTFFGYGIAILRGKSAGISTDVYKVILVVFVVLFIFAFVAMQNFRISF